MPTETVYKVVCVPYNNHTLKSKLVSWMMLPKGWVVTYEPGDLVRPNIENSQLFAFGSLNAAAKALLGRSSLPEELWEAEGEVPQPFAKVSNPWSELYIRQFWREFNSGVSSGSVRLNDAPEGTVGCRSIRLVRKIEPSEYPKVA